MGLTGAKFPYEKTKTADGKADSHEAESGAKPGEERSLGREIDARILFCGLVHGEIVTEPPVPAAWGYAAITQAHRNARAVRRYELFRRREAALKKRMDELLP
jgi:hypothetical protein